MAYKVESTGRTIKSGTRYGHNYEIRKTASGYLVRLYDKDGDYGTSRARTERGAESKLDKMARGQWKHELTMENPLSGPQEYMIGLGVLAAGALGIYLVHRNSAVTPPPLQSGPVPSANPYVLVTNVNPQTATSSTIALPTGATWGQGPTTGYAGGAQGTTAPIILAAGTYPLYWVAPDGSGQITNVIVS